MSCFVGPEDTQFTINVREGKAELLAERGWNCQMFKRLTDYQLSIDYSINQLIDAALIW